MEGWTTTARRRPKPKHTVAEAVYAPEPVGCQKCGIIGRFDRWGVDEMSIVDSPVRGDCVTIEVMRRRYKCRDCGGTFHQPLPDVVPKRRMTIRCRDYIAREAIEKTFTQVAADVGVDEKTVRAIAMERIAELGAQHRPWAPRALGLDETKLDGRLRVVATDIHGRRVIDVLQTYSRASVTNWLSHLPDRGQVVVVVTDMAAMFRDAVRAVLPGVPIVVDKWHVLRAATGALNSVRIAKGRDAKTKAAKKAVFKGRHMLLKRPDRLTPQQAFRLDGMLKNDPDLADAYEAKERFFAIWDAVNRADAETRIAAWIEAIPPRHAEAFKPAARALTEWREEVLAYWTHQVTNAFTESQNHAAKERNRAGRGYSFEVIRARILFREPRAASAELLTCESCHKTVPAELLEVHHLRIGRQRPKGQRICADCHRRIHSEAIR